MSILKLQPAYGRTYGTLEQMRADWDLGKDFKIIDGPYMSIRDVQKNTNNLCDLYASVQIVQMSNHTKLVLNISLQAGR